MTECKFCNGYGLIEITMYHKAVTGWNYTEGVELEKGMKIDCPKCNGLGKAGELVGWNVNVSAVVIVGFRE